MALPSPLVPELEHNRETWTGDSREALLSTSPRWPMRRGNFRSRVWLPAGRRPGLERLRFHDLRHADNTLAAATGARTRELMARMGRAPPRAAPICHTPRASATTRSEPRSATCSPAHRPRPRLCTGCARPGDSRQRPRAQLWGRTMPTVVPEPRTVDRVPRQLEGELGVERVVVRLVDEVGFARALVPEGGQEPGQSLTDVGVVGAVIVGFVQFGAHRCDRLA